jgi:hypothetical protein
MLPSATALAISCQLWLGMFFLSILQSRHPAPVRPVPYEDQPDEQRPVGAAGVTS